MMLILGGTNADAGLFGSIGHALGIGGSVGDALGFADGLLPGGGGITDSIVGGPAKSAFGGAIHDWKDANDASIDKLGKTNDQTVQKLIQGLGTVQADLNKGLQENVLLFSDGLDRSIASLDSTLQETVDRLDNSLNNQTGRMDTVFQKQTSSLFTLGRIFLTVAIIAIFFFFISHILSEASLAAGPSAMLKRNKLRFGVISIVTLLFLTATWLWPDPSGASALNNQLSVSYQKALQYDDFIGANYAASQMQVLSPNDSLIRSYEIKSRAFEDLFYRPTIILNSEKSYEMIARLARADQWHMDATGSNDPDIASAISLVALQSFKSNADIMRATGLLTTAHSLATNSAKGDAGNARWDAINIGLATHLKDLGSDTSLVRQALGGKDVKAVDKLINTYSPASLSWATGDSSPSQSAYSPVEQMKETAVNKMIVSAFYRQLLAFYMDAQIGKIRGDSPSDVKERACQGFRFLEQWNRNTFIPRRNSETFVSLLLAGPFTVVTRMRGILPASDACPGISDEAINGLNDPSSLWISAIQSGISGAGQQRGYKALTVATASLTAKQGAVFDAYETLVASMKTYATRHAAGGDSDRAAHADLLQWLSSSTILGLHYHPDSSVAGLVPAATLTAYADQLSPAEHQTLALQYIYADIY